MRRDNFYYIIACIFLVLTIAYVKAHGSQLKIPLLMAFENLPLQLDEFSGNNIYLYDEIAKYESADNWILRSYTGSKQDIAILVFVGYWENQNENKLIVSPRYVSGAQSFLKKKTMKNSHNNDLVLNEFLMDGKQGKELIYYCFFMDGKVIPDDYQFRFKRMVNSLLYRRNNAALLRVSTPITNDFPVEDAELYIEDFLKDFLPIVKEFLPR